MLFSLSQAHKVVILPGENDPTNRALPQLPLKTGLFSLTSSLGTTQFQSNPSISVIEESHFIFDSGQAINDIGKYSTESNVLKATRLILESRHLAPSAPDTLCKYQSLISNRCRVLSFQWLRSVHTFNIPPLFRCWKSESFRNNRFRYPSLCISVLMLLCCRFCRKRNESYCIT